MQVTKRIVLFVTVNVLIVATLSIVLSILGVRPYLEGNGINFGALLLFCAAWGFGASFISLAISRKMAKWMMGVQVIEPRTAEPALRELVQRVHALSRAARLPAMPEVGIYDSPEINAFATGPTRRRALVAVSTGLLRNMNRREVDGVLAHEVSHIANGDMVTMTLVQGVVNAFVMFLARIVGFVVGTWVDEDKRAAVQFGVVLALEVVLGMLGMMVVARFSRQREFRADEGGAQLSGRDNMIAALERLKLNQTIGTEEQPALATLKIGGRSGGLLKLFATHPDLDVRIARLRERAHQRQIVRREMRWV